jgi:tetratricopeptide (TPR) repeat protein
MHFPQIFPYSNHSRSSRLIPLVFLLALLYANKSLSAQTQSSSAQEEKIQQLYGEAQAAQAAGDLPSASAKYEALLQIAPRLAAAYNNLGSLYLRQREFKKAATALEKGLKLDPKMSSATALLGIAEYEMSDYSNARNHLEAALRANPKDDNIELFLVNNLIKMGELDEAVRHLKLVNERQPKNQEVLYLLGKVHMKLSEEALAKLNKIDADSVWVHEISGEIMESMKNYDGALLEYKKAVELAPEQANAHFLLGGAYWSLARWKEAAKEFETVVSSDPGNCTAHWKMGNALLEQYESPEEALGSVTQALEMCPNLVQARVDRARALMRLDRNEEAVKDLQVAKKTNPDEPNIHFLLGQALRSLGRTNESRAEMEMFTKLQDSAHAATAERAKKILQENNPPKQ